ncbi:MAG TPA: hypothetical protein VGD52_02345 [Pseudoduganella sp.]
MALILSACGNKEVPPAIAKPVPAPVAVTGTKKPVGSKTARMMELLRAAYDAEGGDDYLLVELPDVEQREVRGSYRLEPVAMRELSNGRVALIANAQPANEQGEAMSAHATPGLLNVYVMHREAGGWDLDSRQENIASLGSFGHFGKVEWVSLGNGKPGFTVQHGGTWQGQTISYLSVFDLTERAMHDLTQGLPLFSSDEGNCGDESLSCTSVKGEWAFEKREGAGYDDLVMRFTGHEESRAGDASAGTRRVRKGLSGMARYKFDGKRYVLIEGENIVPEI